MAEEVDEKAAKFERLKVLREHFRKMGVLVPSDDEEFVKMLSQGFPPHRLEKMFGVRLQ